MKKYDVEYASGESLHSFESVDYMKVEVDGIILYAEYDPWNYCPDEYFEETEHYKATGEKYCEDNWSEILRRHPEIETATYERLKADIIEQAEDNQIDPECLKFWYD